MLAYEQAELQYKSVQECETLINDSNVVHICVTVIKSVTQNCLV